jgi:hypothetical protein
MSKLHSYTTAIARAVKAKDAAAEADARRDFAEVHIADVIKRSLYMASPLTEEQRVRLTELLQGTS